MKTKIKSTTTNVTVRITRNASTVGVSIFSGALRLFTEAGFANFNEAERFAITHCEKKDLNIEKIVLTSR